jgi:hypothetical protein
MHGALSPLLVESIALDFDPLKNYLPVAHDGNKKGTLMALFGEESRDRRNIFVKAGLLTLINYANDMMMRCTSDGLC